MLQCSLICLTWLMLKWQQKWHGICKLHISCTSNMWQLKDHDDRTAVTNGEATSINPDGFRSDMSSEWLAARLTISGSIAIQILGRHDHTTDSFTSLHRRQLTYSTSLLQRVPIIVAGINRYNTYIHINIYTQQQHIAAYGLEHTCVFHGFDWHTLKINGVHSDLLSEKLCSQPDPGTVLCHSFSMCLLEPVANTENACSVQRYLFLFWQKMQMDS